MYINAGKKIKIELLYFKPSISIEKLSKDT